jgi:CCR4-NOT transcription complex subunit 1
MNTNFSTNLPDPLRIKPTGVQANQISVYEDFGMS